MRAGGYFASIVPPRLLLALVYRTLKGARRDARWLAAGVVSHWILDAIVHRPDLPLFPGAAASGSASGTILFIHVQQLFGPPPPDERSLAFLALTGWLVPPWGFWIDRTRVVDPA